MTRHTTQRERAASPKKKAETTTQKKLQNKTKIAKRKGIFVSKNRNIALTRSVVHLFFSFCYHLMYVTIAIRKENNNKKLQLCFYFFFVTIDEKKILLIYEE